VRACARGLRVAGLLAVAALAAPIAAQGRSMPPRLIEEPFLGDLAFTQERGEIQITSLMRAAGSAADRTARIPLEIEYGFTDWLELSVETGGLHYARPSGWESPREFGLGVRYGRHGLLPNLHASVTTEIETEKEEHERTSVVTSGVQLGLDLSRLRMTHLFTSVAADVWGSGEDEKEAAWVAGVVVPAGRLRFTAERAIPVSDTPAPGLVAGVVAKTMEGLDVGVATTLLTRPSTRASGVMLSLVFEF
jgi:hypothetical protein